MMDLKIATWNLYQFAKPGTYWYERDERNDYEPDQWSEKKNWIGDMLVKLDADIIGFQEIFSVDEFKAFMTEQGYPHVAVVDDPAIDPEDDSVFLGPVTGIASRHPFTMQPAALKFPQELRDDTQLEEDFNFRRAITRAEIDTPQFGQVVVYVCHFKSQGAFIDSDAVAAHDGWKTRFREHLRARAIKDTDQLVRRSGDAAGVYLAAMDELDDDNNKPLIVVGDMNDNPRSSTLRILTQQEWIDNIAGKRRAGIEEARDRAWNFTWQLFDAYSLLPSQNSATRPVTHAAGWRYPAETLDYILVSNALNPKNPHHVASVTDLKIYSDHFDDASKLLTTDHAPVCVTLTPRPGA
ncbi:endonuclease/exonuclease/phosphatase family protein [Kiloniella sp. EL199]|uniref:endonuclease/exonuclease/phosphatase family protein n=1 Tax=Kiloniella sp. EL199 TaxID=2107581 RepID=UPI000EA1EC96|nr:endonuclease/exonuclease/phosphatase family protein [Kiloniella sp. EL199]